MTLKKFFILMMLVIIVLVFRDFRLFAHDFGMHVDIIHIKKGCFVEALQLPYFDAAIQRPRGEIALVGRHS